MTDEQFDTFLDQCYEEFEEKQSQLFQTYGIGTYQDYWFDQNTQTLEFRNEGKCEKKFLIIPIGTWAHQKNNWMWAWANDSFITEFKFRAKNLLELKHITGNDLFEENGFDCDETMAYELTALGVHHLKAIGFYKIPGERSHLFVAIEKEIIE